MAGEEHTPGTWRIEPITQTALDLADLVAVSGGDWFEFATVVTRVDGEPHPEGMANAHLIASAPELKEASIEQAILIEGAQVILARYQMPGGIDAQECVKRLLSHLCGPDEGRVKALHVAAIAKAKGGEA